MEGVDAFFQGRFEEEWGTPGLRWWKRFLTRRINWQSQRKSLFEYSETWSMIDHGWEHASSLYSSLPRFLWALESFGGKQIFHNPAELYALLVSSFLHDIGMHLLSSRLNTEFRKAASDPGFPYQSQELLRWLNPKLARLRNDIAEFSDSATIRLLHPEIGAWMCDTGQLLADENERRVIAQIVFRHAKRIPKEEANSGFLQLDDEGPALVRIGLISSLIAIADACQLGRKRAIAWQKHIGRIKSEISLWESVCERFSKNGDLDPVKEWCNGNLRVLRKQPLHIFKHIVVDRVSQGPNGFIIVPAFWNANQDWFDFKQPDLHEHLFQESDLPSRGHLIRLACEDIIGELGGPDGSVSVADYLSGILDGNAIPPIPIVDGETWKRTYQALATENDRVWDEFLSSKLGRKTNVVPGQEDRKSKTSANRIQPLHNLDVHHQLVVADVNDILQWGWTFEKLLTELISLDYATIDALNEDHEGHVEQWSPVFRDHPDTWRLLIEGPERICGYWHFVPLFEEELELARRGELFDHQITTDKVKFFELPGWYDIYVVSIALKAEYHRPPFFKLLLSSLFEVLLTLAREDIFVKELVANAYSLSGIKLCKSFGLQHLRDHKDHGKIYVAEFMSLIDHNIFKLSPELISTYRKNSPRILKIVRKKLRAEH